ncbi:hypothetical protein H257_15228 [Aphanomyces astaci]|uniref:Uncharacterized protein n=1 Tax=Aphanomyces astaci TaxID=112090 RepID=W4FN22_APHAT|nr:hypothetical protein H257_15228 [Aphanomyces astaci]ETV68875.1 hypothetical protein H257_15228 [Aphanomyces astaci]|eukprot:XP_009841552.1 hypothetical protein H257_15228 [Aphanomyces astaci]
MSYVRPTRAPIHRTYGEKQDLLRAWNAVEGGGMTLVAFCPVTADTSVHFRKGVNNQDRINRVSTDRVNNHIAPRASILQRQSKPVDPRRLQLHAWMATARSPINLELMRVKVSELWPEWDDISHPAFKHSNYFAKCEPNGVDTFDATETGEQDGGPSGEDTETDDELSTRDPALDRTYGTSKKAPCRPFRKSVVSEDADLFDNDDSLADSDFATLLKNSSHPFSCPFSPSHPSAASSEDSYDSDFEDYFKMTSVPVKFPKALGGKRIGKTPRTKCRPRDHTNPRDITPAPAPPSPAYPKDPATRRAATELSAEPAPVHPKDPATRRAATPLSAAPTPATRRGSNEASATRASTNPKDPAISIKRGATAPPTKIKPTKAPRNLNEAPTLSS